MTSLCPVILAGGGGTRLWPLSRDLYPKQFLSFDAQGSMLQMTLKRLDGLSDKLQIDPPVAICNEEHRFLVTDHAEEIRKEMGCIVLEPQGRNTAPALTIAALLVADSDPVILMMPADHLINDLDAFHRCITRGHEVAAEGMLVTFGIRPDKPETGYGYINCGEDFDGETVPPAHIIKEFVEKPDRNTAEQYIKSGDYFWNSGIFMMKASVWLSAMAECRPDILSECEEAYQAGIRDGIFFRPDKDRFIACPADSIDYAVMEKIGTGDKHRAALVEMDAGWSDIGSWSAVWEVNSKDNNRNVLIGDVIAKDTSNTIVLSGNRLIATIGCHDMLVVATPDAILVGDRNKSQEVKAIVARLKADDRVEREMHTRVYRPWGSYETIDSGDNFQVKRLTVKPGRKLSLQLHHHRAEHWVVVKGVATVTRDTETFTLKENESTYIPLGTRHRLENAGDGQLEVIEVQSGSYLGEDDIVRFADDFGRLNEK